MGLKQLASANMRRLLSRQSDLAETVSYDVGGGAVDVVGVWHTVTVDTEMAQDMTAAYHGKAWLDVHRDEIATPLDGAVIVRAADLRTFAAESWRVTEIEPVGAHGWRLMLNKETAERRMPGRRHR